MTDAGARSLNICGYAKSGWLSRDSRLRFDLAVQLGLNGLPVTCFQIFTSHGGTHSSRVLKLHTAY